MTAEHTPVNSNNNNNDDDEDDDDNSAAVRRVSRRRASSSRQCPSHGVGGVRAHRSAAALKATSCSVMEVDACLRQLAADRLHSDVELLARVLVEYRRLLGLGGHTEARSLEAWPAAWRLARLPAGQWLVSDVLKQADVHAVQPSSLGRGRSSLGAALRDGVDDGLTPHLSKSVSAELKDVALQRAITAVVQALVGMTSSQRHRHHHHRRRSQQQQSVCQLCLALEVYQLMHSTICFSDKVFSIVIVADSRPDH